MNDCHGHVPVAGASAWVATMNSAAPRNWYAASRQFMKQSRKTITAARCPLPRNAFTIAGNRSVSCAACPGAASEKTPRGPAAWPKNDTT